MAGRSAILPKRRESEGVDFPSHFHGLRTRTSLEAKIYRYEDFFTGTIEYKIYPKQTRQSVSTDIQVTYKGNTYSLVEDRPGWYVPLWDLDEESLINGFKLPVVSKNSAISTMYFPVRDFWVLSLDPDLPESGIFASWDKGIELGIEFILLVRESLKSDLNKLRDEGLLSWKTTNTIFNGWYEYHHVIIQSEPQAWNSIRIENDGLRLTLQPRTSFSLNFVGGLRAPRGNGWLVGHGPQLCLASFMPDAELQIFTESEEEIFSSSIEAGQLIQVPWKEEGNYRLIISQGGQSDERIVQITNWVALSPKLMDFSQIAKENNLKIYGAFTGEF